MSSSQVSHLLDFFSDFDLVPLLRDVIDIIVFALYLGLLTGYPLQVLSFIVVFVLIWDLLDIVQLLDLQNDLVRLLVDLLLPLDLNFLIFQGPCHLQ